MAKRKNYYNKKNTWSNIAIYLFFALFFYMICVTTYIVVAINAHFGYFNFFAELKVLIKQIFS